MRSELGYSIVDQAIVSAFNLGLSLTFIALATPAEFGQFVVVQAALIISLAIQGPLVLTPANLLLPGRDGHRQSSDLSMLSTVNGFILATALVICGIAGWAYLSDPVAMTALLAISAASVVREYSRTVFFVRGDARRALTQDALYVALSAVLILCLWPLLEPLAATLCAMAAGHCTAWLIVRPKLHFAPGQILSHLAAYASVWHDARWALIGSLQTEAQTRGYIYITEAWRGPVAVGTLQAGRLLLSPLALAISAWGRVARPSMVASLHNEDSRAAFRTLGSGIAMVLGLAALYGVAILLAWPLIERFIFADRYPDMERIVGVWWVHAVLFCVNGCLGTFAQARRQFRTLAFCVAASAGWCLTALFALSFTGLPTVFALYVLVGTELVLFAGLCWMTASAWYSSVFPFHGVEAMNE